MKETKEHNAKIAKIIFSSVYPFYIKKAEKKGGTKEQVDLIIKWLTGYSDKKLLDLISKNVDMKTFFSKAKINPKARLITGTICGYKVEELKNPITKRVRYLDKLVDELAKGRDMEKILRK